MNQPSMAYLQRLPEPFLQWQAGRALDEVECIVPDLVGIGRSVAR